MFAKYNIGLFKNIKIKIDITITLPVVLYGCEIWSLTLKEEHRLRVFQNRVLRRSFGTKTDEVTGEWRRLHNEKLNDLYPSPNIIRVRKLRRMVWTYGGKERCKQRFGGGNLRERNHLEGPGIDGRIILRRIFRKWDMGTWIGLIWLRMGAYVGKL